MTEQNRWYRYAYTTDSGVHVWVNPRGQLAYRKRASNGEHLFVPVPDYIPLPEGVVIVGPQH